MFHAPQKLLIVLSLAFTLTAFTTSASAADRELVAYRLVSWKTIHFDDAQQADNHVKTIQRLGCEIRTGNHGGHIDVSFRCPQWREISLDTHTKAHNWETWLKGSGFETHHQH